MQFDFLRQIEWELCPLWPCLYHRPELPEGIVWGKGSFYLYSEMVDAKSYGRFQTLVKFCFIYEFSCIIQPGYQPHFSSSLIPQKEDN